MAGITIDRQIAGGQGSAGELKSVRAALRDGLSVDLPSPREAVIALVGRVRIAVSGAEVPEPHRAGRVSGGDREVRTARRSGRVRGGWGPTAGSAETIASGKDPIWVQPSAALVAGGDGVVHPDAHGPEIPDTRASES